MSFEEFSRREQADELKHLAWLVPRRDFPELAEDEFYLMDLVGARGELFPDTISLTSHDPEVSREPEADEPDKEVSGRSLGTLTDIFEAGAGEILVFKGSDLGEVLVPNQAPFVIGIDLEARLVKVRAIPGLIQGVD